MENNINNNFLGIKNFKNIKIMVTVALFTALSIIFGKFLALSVGDLLRFSFENLPIILSGILFGPLVGFVTGIAADLIGCVLRGYAINPILTFGAAVIGFGAGALFKLFIKLHLSFNLILTTFLVHLIGSVIIKTYGLALFYSQPFFATLYMRLLNYSIVFIIEFVLLNVILNNKGFMNQIRRIKQ